MYGDSAFCPQAQAHRTYIHTKEGEGDGNTIYDVNKSSERTHGVTASVRVGGSGAEEKEPGCPTRIRSALPLRPLRLLGDLGQVT